MSGDKKPEDETGAARDDAHRDHPGADHPEVDQAKLDQAKLDQAGLDQAGLDQAGLDQAGDAARRDGDAPTADTTTESQVWGDRDVVDVTPLEARAEAAAEAADPAPEAAVAAQPDPAPARAETPRQEKPAEPAKGGGFASKALAALVLLIAGAALAIWGAPRLAPMLPASLAAYVTPAGAQSDPAVAALTAETARLGAALTAASERADAAGAAAAAADASAEAALAAASSMTERLAELDRAIAQAGVADPALAARLGETEAALATLRADLAAAPAVDDAGALAGALSELRAGAQAQADAIAALGARLDAPPPADPAVAALTERLAGLEARLDAMIAAQEEALAQQAAAAETRESMSLAAALAAVERALYYGEPFAGALGDAAGAVDAPVPDALSAAAVAGAPTIEALGARFDDAARAAIAASLEAQADADGGVLAAVYAKIEARVTGLPADAIAGDDPQAVLSRARAAIKEGDAAAALATLEALPPEAREAMADWIADARLRAEADAAFAAWRADLAGQ